MHRTTAVVFALLVASVIAFVVSRGAQRPRVPATADAGVAPATSVSSAASAAGPADAPTAEPQGGGAPSAAPSADVDAPALATGAPRSVTFGVALVWYRGAESAPPGARSRAEARALADAIAADAKTDFAAALKRADVGIENAGEMRREVLEAPAEAALFQLGPGEIGGPVDSPRGFYVFKRIE